MGSHLRVSSLFLLLLFCSIRHGVLKTNWAETKAIYSKHVLFARVAYKDDRGMQQRLQINGARKSSRAKWLVQAMTFHSKIDKIGEAMGQYGVSIGLEPPAATAKGKLRMLSKNAMKPSKPWIPG